MVKDTKLYDLLGVGYCPVDELFFCFVYRCGEN